MRSKQLCVCVYVCMYICEYMRRPRCVDAGNDFDVFFGCGVVEKGIEERERRGVKQKQKKEEDLVMSHYVDRCMWC